MPEAENSDKLWVESNPHFLPIAIGLQKGFAENRHFHVSANLRYLKQAFF